MGLTLNLAKINIITMDKLLFPIVFCVDRSKIFDHTTDYTYFSLNGPLAEKLLAYGQKDRYLYVSDEINNLIGTITGPILITDFEILFDPEYQLDVLKLFILLNRKQKIAVLWPGKCEQNRLKFAEPEYQDYKSYNINDYDITCII